MLSDEITIFYSIYIIINVYIYVFVSGGEILTSHWRHFTMQVVMSCIGHTSRILLSSGWWSNIMQTTPHKSNIDIKNGHIFKESPFSKPSFSVSMLVFGGVYVLICSFLFMKGKTLDFSLLDLTASDCFHGRAEHVSLSWCCCLDPHVPSAYKCYLFVSIYIYIYIRIYALTCICWYDMIWYILLFGGWFDWT